MFTDFMREVVGARGDNSHGQALPTRIPRARSNEASLWGQPQNRFIIMLVG